MIMITVLTDTGDVMYTMIYIGDRSLDAFMNTLLDDVFMCMGYDDVMIGE